MKIVLKMGWTLVAVGGLAALWGLWLGRASANPIALFAEVAAMSGVTLIAAYSVWWIWFQEG